MNLDAVFEGGGVKGIALIGAASVVEEAGYTWQNLAGTSAGAIVATLLAAGYSTAELREILMGLDLRKFEDTGLIGHIPLLGAQIDIFKQLGIYEGDAFLNQMRAWLTAKGKSKFKDLVIPGQDDPRFKYRVQVVASDITKGQMLVLPRDIAPYGIDPDELEIALAVRMSMSIPFFFKPVTLTDGHGVRSYIVDGGLLSNFPVEIFDSGDDPQWPTFGFCLVPPSTGPEPADPVKNHILGPLTMAWAMFNTAMIAHDAHYMEQPDVSARTIKINSLGISPIQFDLSQDQKTKLYQSGRDCASAFLQGWNFEGYKARFRRGNQPDTRRQRALAQPSTAPGAP